MWRCTEECHERQPLGRTGRWGRLSRRRQFRRAQHSLWRGYVASGCDLLPPSLQRNAQETLLIFSWFIVDSSPFTMVLTLGAGRAVTRGLTAVSDVLAPREREQ